MTDFNNDYPSPDQHKTAAGDPPETDRPGTDSSYHYSGAQGSFGEAHPDPSAAGDFSYGSKSYQAEHGSGPIPEFHYNAVPPQKPPKKKKKLALVAVLISVGMVAVIVLSMVAGGMLVQHLTVGPAASSSESQPEHLVINSSPKTDTSTTPASGVMTTTQIAQKASGSVVGINLYSPQQVEKIGEASGIVLDKNGYIITNAHVVSDGYAVTVVLSDGTEKSATVVGYDTRTDLAVVKIDPAGLTLTPAEFGDSSKLQLGDDVVAIGNAGGYYNSVTKGIVSGLDREVSTNISIKLIQTDAAINPGNSGGALLNQYGQVIGINSSKIASSEIDSMGFAIPINDAKPIIDSLINYGYVKDRVALGVTVVALNGTNGSMMGLPSQGLYITQISADSDLYAQGITRGDVILTAGDVTLTTNSDLLKELENYKPGETIQLTILKGTGEKVTVNATLHEMTTNN